jgi:hypothetical protein
LHALLAVVVDGEEHFSPEALVAVARWLSPDGPQEDSVACKFSIPTVLIFLCFLCPLNFHPFNCHDCHLIPSLQLMRFDNVREDLELATRDMQNIGKELKNTLDVTMDEVCFRIHEIVQSLETIVDHNWSVYAEISPPLSMYWDDDQSNELKIL